MAGLVNVFVGKVNPRKLSRCPYISANNLMGRSKNATAIEEKFGLQKESLGVQVDIVGYAVARSVFVRFRISHFPRKFAGAAHSGIPCVRGLVD